MLILTGGRIGIVKAYLAVFSPPPFGTFWVYPPPGGKRYDYHGWPLGQPGPAIPSLAGCILATRRQAEKNSKVSSFTLAPSPPNRTQIDTAEDMAWYG